MKILRRFVFFLVLTSAVLAADLKVGTLNCYLLFDPSINHRGKVDDDNRMTSAQYQQKLTNLATLTKGYDVVALQEIGGKTETMGNKIHIVARYGPRTPQGIFSAKCGEWVKRPSARKPIWFFSVS